jgi:predicted HAD superfamily Cof-like phosphohydrolase
MTENPAKASESSKLDYPRLMDSAKDFRVAFECSNQLTEENTKRQIALIREEYTELIEAHFQMVSSDYADKFVADFLKESCDLIYVIAQYAAFLRLDIDEAYRRVHENNMTKIGPDGKVMRRADGKILKPPGYKSVDLSDLVE